MERRPPGDVAALLRLASACDVELPPDYVEFMAESDGGHGDVGSAWLELWSVDEIEEAAEAPEPRYEGVLLFAGDGGNKIYGFDSTRGSEIIEGDWIGLGRDEVISHGPTFVSFLQRIAETD